MLPIISGIVAGMGHVVTGPDHLAAVGPLSLRQEKKSWLAGVRWGAGHSAGVAVVGLISLLAREALPLDRFSGIAERLVGVVLIGIGFWGLRKSFNRALHAHEHEHGGDRHTHIHFHGHSHSHEAAVAAPKTHQHSHAVFGVGILHGLAGSSHFIGVLPALAFPTRGEAIAYILAYGIGTVLAMGMFTSALGWVSQRGPMATANGCRIMMGAVSFSALVVGIYWLASA